MDDAERRPRTDRASEELPVRYITLNELVAYNLGWFRRAADMRQQDLGKRLGWTNVAVSAAERSWHGGRRIRQFDADVLGSIAAAFALPYDVLVMPPEDDGVEATYLLRLPSGDNESVVLTMEQWVRYFLDYDLELAVRTPVHLAYQERYSGMLGKYVAPSEASEFAERMRGVAADRSLAETLREARKNRKVLDEFELAMFGLVEDNYRLRQLLVTVLRQTPDGRALLRDEDIRSLRENDGERRWQQSVIRVGRELFGARGPTTQQELERVLAEMSNRRWDDAREPAVIYRDDGTLELLDPDDLDRADPGDGDQESLQ